MASGDRPRLLVESLLPSRCARDLWVDKMHLAHILDHPLYGEPDGLTRVARKDLPALRTRVHTPSTPARGEVDFLFIDVDHSYERVRRDFELYSPLAADGRLVAFTTSCRAVQAGMEIPETWRLSAARSGTVKRSKPSSSRTGTGARAGSESFVFEAAVRTARIRGVPGGSIGRS
jgi:hypothetical protein